MLKVYETAQDWNARHPYAFAGISGYGDIHGLSYEDLQ